MRDYSIGEVAVITGLSQHTLRWYERIGLIDYIERDHSGQRRFSDRDLGWLELIGPFVRAHRDEVTLATKFSIIRKADDPAYRGIDNSPAYIRRAVEASLRRLGIETIDLYYAHRRDPRTPIEDMMGTLAELIQQ